MYVTLSTSDVAHRLAEDSYSGFSLSGGYALADHLDECGDFDGVEFDGVALRCEWAEYESAQEACEDMGVDYGAIADTYDDEWAQVAIEQLIAEGAVVVFFDGGVVVSSF